MVLPRKPQFIPSEDSVTEHRGINKTFLYEVCPALKAPALYLYVYNIRAIVFESIFINEY